MRTKLENVFYLNLKYCTKIIWREYQIFCCKDASMEGSLSLGVVDDSVVLQSFGRVLHERILEITQEIVSESLQRYYESSSEEDEEPSESELDQIFNELEDIDYWGDCEFCGEPISQHKTECT